MNKIMNIISQLPPIIREVILQAAKSIGCPVEFSFGGFLATISIAIGNSHWLEIKPSYQVSALLYISVLGDPGSKKTPSIDLMLKPIINFQEQLYEDYLQELETAHDKDEKPQLVQIMTSDTTTEALAGLLYNSPHGIIVYRDELAGLIKSFNAYKNGGGDIENYLSYWSSSMITVNRKSLAKPIFIKKPFVALIGGIQPTVIQALKNFRDNGFAERLLYIYPGVSENKYSTFHMEDEVINSYNKFIYELISKNKEISERKNPIILKFSSDAQLRWNSWADELSNEKNENTPIYLRNYWNKLESYTGRLALIFHFCNNAGGNINQATISLDTLEIAIQTIEFFKEEARKVWRLYDMDPEHDNRIAIAIEQIKQRALPNGFISRRTVLSFKIGRVSNNSDVDGLFEELELMGVGKPTDFFKTRNNKVIHGFILSESALYNSV